MKQYEVVVMEKHNHGCWGKMRYFGMVLAADSIAKVEAFAIDVLAGMTPNEINEEAQGKFLLLNEMNKKIQVDKNMYMWVKMDLDKPIGYEEAVERFSVKASVMR